MLKSFVSDEDYPKLVEIVKKIRDGVFNDVSILEIYGGYASGKSTFKEFLKKLSGGRSIMIDSRIGDNNYYTSPRDELSAFKKSITVGELYDDNPDTLTKYHLMINKPLSFRAIYQDFQIIDTPATLIVATIIRQEIPIVGWEKRLPLYLHFPNHFDGKIPYDEIIKLCLDETKTL